MAILLLSRISPENQLWDDETDAIEVDTSRFGSIKQSYDERPTDKFDDMDKIEINDKLLNK